MSGLSWSPPLRGTPSNCAHIFGHAHTLLRSVSCSPAFFFFTHRVTQPGSQSAPGLACSHIHGDTQRKHATVCIYRDGFECKCSQSSSPTNICEAASERRRYLPGVSSAEEVEDGGGEVQRFSDVLRVSRCVFRMGGIPAKTHKEEKLLIYLGIIDILQSYRYC